jgi:hypothetical protein
MIASTRFNNETWRENKEYRNKIRHTGCIYGCTVPITNTIPEDSTIYIFEMNNSLNRIEGIGLIKNKLWYDNYYKIYKDGNYNRFIYKSNYRIDRSYLEQHYSTILKLFELILFKGKTHLKRGFGITKVPEKLMNYYYPIIYDKNTLEERNREILPVENIKLELNNIFSKYINNK